jgi:hypothetical protein
MRHGFAKATTLALLLIFIAQGATVVGQQGRQNGLGPQVRDLNNQLLTVFANLRNLPPGNNPAALRGQADSIIGQRAAVLESMAQDDPSEALALAFLCRSLERPRYGLS